MSFFSLSKAIWTYFNPIQVIIYFLLFLLVFNFFNKKKIIKIINLIIFILFILIIFLPNGSYMLWKLENTYSKPKILPSKIDGMLILGSGVNPFLSEQHNQLILTESIERITESIELMKRFPNAKIVYSGGSFTANPEAKLTGIDVAKMFYTRMGIDVNKIIFEDESLNTYENFVFSRKYINNINNEKWLLLTSAFHMKRAMSVAEKLKLNFIPYPVDYVLENNFKWKRTYIIKGRSFLRNLNHFQLAAHEYIGLAVYYLTKRSSKIY